MPVGRNQWRLVGLTVLAFISCALTVLAANPADFTVKSATDDSTFQLSKHRGEFVALHFLLKTECPYCLKYTHAYSVLSENEPGVTHLFLKPDSESEIKAWAGKLSKAELKELPRIYRDPEAKLADQFKVPKGYKFHGQTVHYPALVVLDGEGKELFRHVGKNNSDRMAVKDFVAKLAETQGKSSKATTPK